MSATSFFGGAYFGGEFFNSSPPVPPAPDSSGGGFNWQVPRPRKSLSNEELMELIRQQRIEMGIIPPDQTAQPVPEAAQVAEEVAAAMNDRIQMSDTIDIDYGTIYRAAFLEAETAIAEYRKEKTAHKKRIRRAATTLLLH